MKLTSRRVYTRGLLILFLSLSFAVISQLLTAEAATTFIVNTLGDTPDAAPGDGSCADATGSCTLRAAIQEANALAGDEAISFSVTGTINLTGALPDLSSLTINGPGSNQLTVRRDTGGDYRIFSIPGANVSISGLTVTNGKTPDGGNTSSEGGGIFIFAGSLRLNDVSISGNRTGSGVVVPGNPFASDGASGGGLASHAALTMTNCRVTGNSTGKGADGVGGRSGFGGGIYFTVGSSLTNVVVDGNRTGDAGTDRIQVPVTAAVAPGAAFLHFRTVSPS